MEELTCCYENCMEDAVYEVIYGYSPDDYTHSCIKHLGLMIPEKESTVVPLWTP